MIHFFRITQRTLYTTASAFFFRITQRTLYTTASAFFFRITQRTLYTTASAFFFRITQRTLYTTASAFFFRITQRTLYTTCPPYARYVKTSACLVYAVTDFGRMAASKSLCGESYGSVSDPGVFGSGPGGGRAPRMPVNIIDHVLTNAHPCPKFGVWSPGSPQAWCRCSPVYGIR